MDTGDEDGENGNHYSFFSPAPPGRRALCPVNNRAVERKERFTA